MIHSFRSAPFALLPLLVSCGADEHLGAEDDSLDVGVRSASAPDPDAETELATFAGGCFWCMEKPFEVLPGVHAVVSGYTGGEEADPTYEEVSRGGTGHAEAVQITYDPARIRYEDLLEVFWRQIDPTDAGGQFVDRGRQYRPEIFVHSAEQRAAAEASKERLAASGRFEEPIATGITDYERFFPAEEYHQDFYVKSPDRYHSYRSGSGRDRFLDRVWGEERTWRPAGAGSGHWRSFVKPSEEELRERLSPEAFHVTQEDGTERAFTGELWDNHEAGLYVDVVSGEPLFSSQDKFDSGTGWPSFTRPVTEDALTRDTDRKLGYPRTEVRSAIADSHLGHVFEDGPEPTGLRYCINSAALRFVPAAKLEAEGYGELADRFREGSSER